MKFLLDTHVVLWAAMEPEKLSSRVVKKLRLAENGLLISVASVWEIAVKVSIGKLHLPMDLRAFVRTTVGRLNAVVIPVSMDDTLELVHLPLHHKDPFDRILVAQARNHSVTLITQDSKISRYNIETFW